MACVAYGCTNRTSKQKSTGITFHMFPKNEQRREAWVKAVRRKNWQPTQYSRLCSEHFKKDDFDSLSHERVYLKENAVPTIFKAFPSYFQKAPIPARKPVKRVRLIELADELPKESDKTLGDWKQYVIMKADRISNSLNCSDGSLPKETLQPLEETLASLLGRTFEDKDGNVTSNDDDKFERSNSSLKRILEDEEYEEEFDNSEQLSSEQSQFNLKQKMFNSYQKKRKKQKNSKKDEDDSSEIFIEENEERRIETRLVEAEEQKADALQRLALSFESIATSVEFLCHTLLQKK